MTKGPERRTEVVEMKMLGLTEMMTRPDEVRNEMPRRNQGVWGSRRDLEGKRNSSEGAVTCPEKMSTT